MSETSRGAQGADFKAEPQMRTALRQVRGLGPAHSGTGHFIQQRFTAIANVPLALGFVFVIAWVAGADYDAARRMVSHPLAALVLLLFIVSACAHMRVGMQTILEDYVHSKSAKIATLVLNSFFAAAVAVAAAYAVIRIGFGVTP